MAVEPGTAGSETDADRPLIPQGERRLRAAAAAMKKMELSFDLILSSPFLRARQTAEIIARKLKLKTRLEISDALAPGGDTRTLLRQLNEQKPAPENVLLVGHEPYLSRLIGLLTSNSTDATVEIKKGGLGRLEIGELRPGRCAKLVWLLTPSQMELMA